MSAIKLKPTKRAIAMIAGAVMTATAAGWGSFTSAKLTPAHPDVTPVIVHEAIDKGITPPAVLLSIELIKKWEGFSNIAYQDSIGKWTIGFGDTLLNGRPVRKGDYISRADAEKLLVKRFTYDYFLPLVDKVPGFTKAPVSVQAGLGSLAYNIGVGDKKRGAIGSSSAKDIARYDYVAACNDLLKFNKAGGRELKGLTNRRGMGDPGRAGEGEICISGLPK